MIEPYEIIITGTDKNNKCIYISEAILVDLVKMDKLTISIINPKGGIEVVTLPYTRITGKD